MAGDTITFTITVENLGPSNATGVELTDILPTALMFVSAAATTVGTYNATSGIWDIGAITVGTTVTLTIVAKAMLGMGEDEGDDNGGTMLTNTAEITAHDQVDPDSTNNKDSADVHIVEVDIDLSGTKTVDDDTPIEGQTILYKIDVTNNGPDNATNVVIQKLFPANVTFVSSSQSPGTTYNSTNSTSHLWTIGDLNVGVVKFLNITATIDNGTAAWPPATP